MQKVKLQVKNQKLPKGWRKVKLGELADITSSKRIYLSDYVKEGIPFFRSKEIIEKHDDQKISTELYISKEKFKKIKETFGAPTENDLLLTSVGTIGIPYLVKKDDKFYFKDGNLIWFRNFKNSNPKFIYYWFESRFGKEAINSIMIGSSQSAITIISLKNLEIILPEDIAEQKRIADILSAFDEKIELNNKINQVLEQMAQEIFREWFVKFRFPGHEKVKMIDSELGKIPEGWKVLNAEKVFIFERGVEPGSKYYNEERKENYIPFFRVKDLLSEKAEVYIPREVSKNKICREKDVLLSLDASIGRVQIGCNGSYSSGIRKIYPQKEFGFIGSSFIYLWVKSLYVQNVLSTYLNSGSTIAHAGKATKDFTLPFNKDIIIKFQKITDPMLNIILKNKRENQKLAALRDLLLPKLMSGEIRG